MTDPPDDVAALEAEFPAWEFGVRWTAANSGSDGRVLYAWPLEGGTPLTAATADGLRRRIREAQR